MNQLNEQRLKFLNDTITHFNISNRAITPEGGCCYSKTSSSTGCAIGRHLEVELAGCLDNSSGGFVNNENIFDKLPDKLKELGKGFLTRIQTLHDTEENWAETGLSDIGKIKVKEIKKDFKLK